MTPEKFVITFYSFAKESFLKTGIHPVATLAQGALESGWGEKVPGNMMFGVKAGKDTPESKRQLITTTEYMNRPDCQFPVVISVTPVAGGRYRYKVKDWFRKYDTPEESFTDHANFFFANKRYASALLVKDDPYKFIQEIAKAGYATDPLYAKTLTAIAKKIEVLVSKLKLK